MGWLDLFRSGETRSAGNDTLAALGATWLGEGRGSSRYPAESLAVVQACVAAISGHLAGLPVAVYERRGEERIEASAHPFAGLFRRGPNAWQSWPEFVEWLAASALLAGNGLAEVVSDGAGRVTELRPIPWGLVRVERAPVGRVIYHVTGDDLSGRRGTTRRLLPSEVIHLRCRTDDGIVGVAPLRRAAAAADMAIEVDAHTRETWRNSGRPGGVLMHEKAISEAAASRLRTNWIDRYGGEGAGKPAVLEEGMKFEPFPTISPEDAELLAARRYSGEELARIYQVPPPMIGDLTHGTFANTEQLLRYFAISTLAGWARRLETALSRGVLTREERSRFEIDVSLDGLLRGSAAERWSVHKIAIDAGVLDPDEVREAEGWNPREKADTPPTVAS